HDAARPDDAGRGGRHPGYVGAYRSESACAVRRETRQATGEPSMTTHQHPSFLELDWLALSGAPPPQGVAECPSCTEHMNAVRRGLPVPSWIREAGLPKRKRWPLPALSFAVAATLTSVLVLVTLPRTPMNEVRSKGVPSVELFVKRGSQVSRWTEGVTIRPDDA